MHVLVAVWAVAAAWLRADWRRWYLYQSTMLYMGFLNMIYNFITNDFQLWETVPDLAFMNHMRIELLYSVVLFPATVLLFLSRLPDGNKKRLLHVVKWATLYTSVELVAMWRGAIVYHNGWNLGWSLAFNAIAFPMLILHHKKPLIAYGLSVFFTVSFVLIFKVPMG